MTEPAPDNYPYVTRLDHRFQPLEVIDIPSVVGEVADKWFNQTLCKVNESGITRVHLVTFQG